MKIKAKLNLGIGLLFAMIVLLTGLSSLFIYKLSGDTKNILVANYNTLDYSRQMLIALNKGITGANEKKQFEDNLSKQQQNITEVGEKELTEKLTEDYKRLNEAAGDSGLVSQIRSNITDIMLLNMQAIERKSKIAEETADTSIFWVAIIGTFCFLIAFTLLVNLPGNIANPIKELTESIKQIAAQNYSRRVHFAKPNEFGELASSFNTMAEKLEEYKAGNLEKLMMEKKRIETLINNMNDPVIGLDENNLILFMNDTALKATGLKKEDALSKSIQSIAEKNDLIRSLLKEFNSPKKGDKEYKQEPFKIFADNKESYFNKQIIPIKIIPTGEKEEKLVGNVILLQNITSFKELDFAKTNFIATISHELKTPLASIKMSLQLLDNKKVGELNDEQKYLMGSIQDDADRLLKITSELLNMTQVEAGSIQLAVLPVSPTEIIEYAINSNKQAAENKKISLQITKPENIQQVLADNEKTAWVLTNLISNAIRYSYENSIIQINVKPVDDKIVFSVTDTGQGIAPEYVDKIFNRYFRIPGSQKEGTGLGLSISKEFIEAQGGKIFVKSEFGSGSTFMFELPTFNSQVL